jgi:sporulation protein YlmC with PRC-barrel domain
VVAPAEAEVGHVLGAKVVTDAGREVGTVLDVVVESGAGGRVVGFQIASNEAAGRRKDKVYIPRGQTLAVSGHALVVPANASHFIAEGLASFTAQVEIFERHQADEPSPNPSTGQTTGGPA